MQTDLTSQGIFQMQQELKNAYHKINTLEAKLTKLQPFTDTNFKMMDDHNLHFYRSLPNSKKKKVFESVISERFKRTKPSHMHVLSDFQEFVADQIEVEPSSTKVRIQSRHFPVYYVPHCVNVSYKHRYLPPKTHLWPDHPQLRRAMSKCFLLDLVW